MHMIRRQRSSGWVLFRYFILASVLFVSRPAMAEDEATATGTVTPPFSNTSTIGTAVGKPRWLDFARIRKPENFSLAAREWAISKPGVETGFRTASEDTILRAAVAEEDTAAVPAQSDRTQRQIEREARKIQLGVRAGVALDPELILMGVQAQFGPIFKSNLSFRPSVEFALGEVTSMFGFNGEFIYRLPMSSQQDRSSTYFGGGLGINLLHQNFERDTGGKRIDFGDFHSDSALNILAGVRNQSGIFMELRTSIYSDPSPTLRLVVGYSF